MTVIERLSTVEEGVGPEGAPHVAEPGTWRDIDTMAHLGRITLCTLAAGAGAIFSSPLANASAAPSSGSAAATSTYTVVRGDTLSRIAARHHTTVARLVELNRQRYPSLAKNPNLIFAGWVLTFDASASGTRAAPVSAPRAPAAPANGAVYVVRRGDNLSRIAARHHTTVARLVQLNKQRYPSLVKNPNRIFAGWVLQVG